ncbi:DUF2690 domain-containing protein [Streptomyces sp. NPDC127108]|uniref:DUF2690 domain-containing protein n=1 Tax=Streptomyces sp. NPDC127108 TaxID=3345361 RepID=UPI0036308A73
MMTSQMRAGRARRAFIALGLTGACVGLTLGGTASASAEAAPTADAASACNYNNPITAKRAKVDSINIELRYSTSTRCAWGRITNARVGDAVWTDRSYDGGRTWEKHPEVKVRTGTDTFTDPRYDGGHLMRACAWNHATGHRKCTDWF